MAGMWVHEVNDTTAPFSGSKVAINRAMATAHCTSDSFDTAQLQNFPIGFGNADDTCKRVVECDPLYPLVVCPLAGNGKSSHDSVVNPGWSTFIKMFEVAPLLTP